MSTVAELSTVKAALDAGLVSQADYDAMKRKFLALQATLQQRKADADLRAFALESIVKHGSSLMSEEQRVDLVRDYVRTSGLGRAATEQDEPASKKQRPSSSSDQRAASPPLPLTAPGPAALPPPAADASAPAVANQLPAPDAPAPLAIAPAAPSTPALRAPRIRSRDSEQVQMKEEGTAGSRKRPRGTWVNWTLAEEKAIIKLHSRGSTFQEIQQDPLFLEASPAGRTAKAIEQHLYWAAKGKGGHELQLYAKSLQSQALAPSEEEKGAEVTDEEGELAPSEAEIENAGVNQGEGSSVVPSLPLLRRNVRRKSKAIVEKEKKKTSKCAVKQKKKKQKGQGRVKMFGKKNISDLTTGERKKLEEEALARGPGLRGEGIGCGKCRWAPMGCTACNPEKLAAHEEKLALGMTGKIPIDADGFRVCDKCGFKVQWVNVHGEAAHKKASDTFTKHRCINGEIYR